MTSKEMKLVKFETLISDLAKKMNRMNCFYKYQFNPLELLFGENVKDEYAKIAMKSSFDNLRLYYSLICNDINRLIEICNDPQKSIVCNHIIFFGLIVVSIDCDAYDEKLSILTDFAYIIGFDEDMMSDWIYAVKSILSAKMINLSKIKSENAKTFFNYLTDLTYQED